MKNLKLRTGDHCLSMGPPTAYVRAVLVSSIKFVFNWSWSILLKVYIQECTCKTKLKSLLPHSLHIIACPVGDQRSAPGLSCWWGLTPVTNCTWWQNSSLKSTKDRWPAKWGNSSLCSISPSALFDSLEAWKRFRRTL